MPCLTAPPPSFPRRRPSGCASGAPGPGAVRGGAGGLGAWLLLALAGVLATLPPAVDMVSAVLARGGLLSFGFGVIVYLVTRRRQRQAEERPRSAESIEATPGSGGRASSAASPAWFPPAAA